MNNNNEQNMQDGGMNMRLQTVQDALNQKNIRFEYTEEDRRNSVMAGYD